MSGLRRCLRAPSPALVVAVLALAVASGGVATAAIVSSDGSVNVCRDARNGSLRAIDSGGQCRSNEEALAIASTTNGKVADADLLDGKDSSSFHRGAFGIIKADGTLVAGRGIETTHLETNASGGPVFSIGFAEDVTRCAIQLTVVDSAKGNYYPSIPDGTAAGSFISDNAYPVYQGNVDSGIFVRTRDAAGTVVARPFQVAAIC